ncbi:MAG: hypothetical protein KDA05_04045 [Phycisphaerales bacterium]|nr:hypothetical protein [Phycisphaerales bacterium]
MRAFSRVGVLPITVFLHAAGVGQAAQPVSHADGPSHAHGAQPETTDLGGVLLHDVNADAQTTLEALRGSMVALHFAAGLGDDARLALVRDTLDRAPEVAGVRHVFVHSGPVADAHAWLDSLADEALEAHLVHDEGDTLRRALERAGGGSESADTGTPRLFVLDADGSLLLAMGDDPRERRRFDAFAARMREVSRTAAIEQYNLPRRSTLGVEGYDLVAYQTQNRAVRGSERFTSEYRGVQYRFSSAANRATFAAAPDRYTPTYGGWCASAMGDGGRKVEISPTNFAVQNGRLHLFYRDMFSNARSDWDRHPEWEGQADAHWRRLAGEEPRKPE